MVSTIERWVGYGAVAAFFIVAGPGCDDSCAFAFRCATVETTGGGSGTGGEGGSGGGEANPCPDDPADGPVAPECGVWVAASWGADAKDGTQAAPVATLAAAVELALNGTGRIYACGETYVETVKLPAGISLAGGFSCERGFWKYEGEKARANVQPMVPGVPAITLLDGTAGSLITDIRVEAADAIEPGGSSIAILALGTFVTIKRSEIIAGDAADGADGEDGSHDGFPAPGGLEGKDGANACTADPGAGGDTVTLACGGVDSAGGAGGDGGELFANDGAEGVAPPEPNDLEYGAGGKGESVARGTACTGGAGGQQGQAGKDGDAALGTGTLTKEGYRRKDGGDGVDGMPGQGGGGGGGSIGSAILCGAALSGGAGGGSGGTGGCGGRGGKGGQAGGSSIAVAVASGWVLVDSGRLVSGRGGKGGRGGSRQKGGPPGLPGKGGMGFGGASGVKAGCSGGPGGWGGNGGSGAGGQGGHSLSMGIAPGAAGTPWMSVEFSFGPMGMGGDGGDPAIKGLSGANGLATSHHVFNVSPP